MKFSSFMAISAMFVLAATTGCKKDEEIAPSVAPTEQIPTTFGSVNLTVSHSFGDSDFALSSFYTNGSNEPMSFSAVKYYVSNIQLVTTSGTVRTIDAPSHLINLASAGSNIITLDHVPTGNYASIRMNIGMDHNSMLPTDIAAFSDANPEMYWNDADGFIFVKLRAYSPDASNGTVDLNLGGCAAPNIAMMQVNSAFSGSLSVVEDGVSTLTLDANLANVFDGTATTLSVTQTSDVISPCELGVNLARNFAEGFSFSSFD